MTYKLDKYRLDEELTYLHSKLKEINKKVEEMAFDVPVMELTISTIIDDLKKAGVLKLPNSNSQEI
jgi:uncharacterized protein (UPF0335 family)